MLTFNDGLQMAALVLGAVLATLGLGFGIGYKINHNRPRLGAAMGFFAVLTLGLGPVGILASTFQLTLTACLASVGGWLVVSGFAWGVVLSNFAKSKRGSKIVSFIQAMYLVGIGVMLTGTIFNRLAYVPGAGPEDLQLWGRHIGVFSLTSMVYLTFGAFVYWMYRWQRGGLAQATPVAPKEIFAEPAAAAVSTVTKPLALPSPVPAPVGGDGQSGIEPVTSDGGSDDRAGEPA